MLSYKRTLYIHLPLAVILLLALLIFFPHQALAFSNISDTITTSRPSASSPLNANAATSDTQLTIFNNSSRYLASDSARILRTSTGGQISSGLIVASQSAGLTTVFLGNTVGAAAQAGTDVLLMPATAMHTVQFTTGFQLSVSDTWKLTFPTLTSGDSNVAASASASTFQLNNVVSNIKIYDVTTTTDITANFSITATNPTAGTSPIITLTLSSTPVIAGHTIKVFLGCSALTSGACSTQVPTIINPTKAAANGTGDTWKIGLSQNGSATDSTTIAVGTIESVTVRATVDPTLSFTIAGLANATAINNGNSGCSLASLTNTGISAAANDVNLGIVQGTPSNGGALTNVSGQTITISTNGANGYSLTATSSSGLINPQTGFFFRSSTTPIAFPNSAATPAHFFGLHPCGVDVNTTWIQGGAAGSSTCNVVTGSAASNCFWAWPTTGAAVSSTPITLASASVGPIGSGNGTAGSGIVSIAYSAGTDVTVPPGQYRTVITYIATPTF